MIGDIKMTSLKFIKAENYEELSKIGAAFFVQQLNEKPASVLGLATGGTPEGLYKQLVTSYKQGEVSFENAVTFNLDEYTGITEDNAASYHHYMAENLFKHVNIQASNINLPKGNVADPEASTVAYEALIAQAGGIDLQLLGIGVNGHIGFNEPHTPFTATTTIIELTPSTREANQIYFDKLEDVPTHAITMGIKTILNAKKIVLVMSGESKRKAFEQLRSGKVSEDFPASALHLHEDVTVIYTDID